MEQGPFQAVRVVNTDTLIFAPHWKIIYICECVATNIYKIIQRTYCVLEDLCILLKRTKEDASTQS